VKAIQLQICLRSGEGGLGDVVNGTLGEAEGIQQHLIATK